MARFHEAQSGQHAGYEKALREIQSGRKSSHWIWYIFPQLEGLGQSSTARHYAIRNLEEALAYLDDPQLCARYREVVEAALEHLQAGTKIDRLMGSEIDARKLASSLTLFRIAAREAGREDLEPLFAQTLELCAKQGYPECALTRESLKK